jgi:hypothetical protein
MDVEQEIVFFAVLGTDYQPPPPPPGWHVNRQNLYLRENLQYFIHLPPHRFYCVEGSVDRTQDSCNFGIGCQRL